MLTDLPGVLVGHAQRRGQGWATGVTAIVPPPGTIGAVDVRGGGPGTHETDALEPGTLVSTVDAIALCGGSAYGLVAAHGVQRWCEEQDRGFPVALADGRPVVVPIVPAAAIFDLGRGGDFAARPDEQMGYQAALAAGPGDFDRGPVGAGTGARTARGEAPGGVGTATVRLTGGILISALVVLNAAGVVTVPGSGSAGSAPAGSGAPGAPAPESGLTGAAPGQQQSAFNTTLVVVATNARLDVAAARRMAGAGHDGLARTISPVHTLMDGDTVFALATGELDTAAADPTPQAPGWPGADSIRGLAAVQAAAAEAVAAAVLDAWHCATNL